MWDSVEAYSMKVEEEKRRKEERWSRLFNHFQCWKGKKMVITIGSRQITTTPETAHLAGCLIQEMWGTEDTDGIVSVNFIRHHECTVDEFVEAERIADKVINALKRAK